MGLPSDGCPRCSSRAIAPNTMAATKNAGISPTILGDFFTEKDQRENHSERELLLQKAHRTVMTAKVPNVRRTRGTNAPAVPTVPLKVRLRPYFCSYNALITTRMPKMVQNRMSITENRNEPRNQNH